MAYHNTIPDSATYIHLHTPIHGNTPIVATLFFSLPLTTLSNGSWWYWQHNGDPQQAMKINTHPTTAQHTNVLPVTLVFSESVYLFTGSLLWSNNIFLNDPYHYMVFSISEFPANIDTFITNGLAQASNIYTPSSHMVSPNRFYFFSLEPILCTSIIPLHEPYFFPYMVLNTNITFETNLSILSNTIIKFISPNHHARKTSTTPVRFLHIL